MAPDIRVSDEIAECLTKLGVPYELLSSQPEEKSVRGPEIITPSNRWLIELSHRGKTGMYELSQHMLPSMNFQDSVRYAENARTNGEFSLYDSQFNFSAFRSVVNSNASEKDAIIKFLRRKLRDTFPSTTTLAVYNYDGKRNDKFVHDAGMKSEYVFPVKIVGPDRIITPEDSSVLEGMLGEKNVDEVSRVISEINKIPAYIYRENAASQNVLERVVRFYADSVRLYLSACRIPLDEFPSFGYRLVEQEK